MTGDTTADRPKSLVSHDEPSMCLAAYRLIGVVGQLGCKSVADKARVLEFARKAQLGDGAGDIVERCRRLRSEVLQWDQQEALR